VTKLNVADFRCAFNLVVSVLYTLLFRLHKGIQPVKQCCNSCESHLLEDIAWLEEAPEHGLVKWTTKAKNSTIQYDVYSLKTGRYIA